MKGAIFGFAAAALLISATASGHEHKLAHAKFHKRDAGSGDVSTSSLEDGCHVVWSTWYGEASSVQEPAPSSTPDAPSQAPPPAVPTSASSSAAPVQPSPTAPPASTPSVKVDASSNSSSSNSAAHVNVLNKAISSNGAMGMTYSPYSGTGNDNTGCKTPDQVTSDMQAIQAAGFNTVRIYATNCDQLVNVAEATKSLGMSMILGVYFNSASSAQQDLDDQLKDINSYFQSQGGYGGVDLITIGNEAISSGFASADQLSDHLAQARSSLSGSGYQGPISTALIVGDWQQNPSLCSDVDVLASNIHPFFSDNTVQPSDSGPYLDSQVELLQKACGGSNKPVVVTEAGWPTQGSANNGMVPSPSNQQAAIKSMRGSQSAKGIMFFSNSDDLWKAGSGVQTYELHFGCLAQFGQ